MSREKWKDWVNRIDNLLGAMMDVGETYTSNIEVHQPDLQAILWASTRLRLLEEVAEASKSQHNRYCLYGPDGCAVCHATRALEEGGKE